MSKYFLNRQKELLTHGAEIFELSLGKENYRELAEARKEKEFFTFQMTVEAIKEAFPGYDKIIVAGFVEMLTFDALIGHNDRHPYNWGVIAPIYKNSPPRFSPVYDTARALFWNIPEKRVRQMLSDKVQFETYVRACEPPIGWDGQPGVDFFTLIRLIWQDFASYRRNVEKFFDDKALQCSVKILHSEFFHLMSAAQRELIERCLRLRQQRLKEVVRI